MKLYDVIRKDTLKKGAHEEEMEPRVFVPTEHPRKKRKRILFFGLILAGIVVLYIVGVYINRATIFITERTIPFMLDRTVIELPHETKSDSGRLSFKR